MLQQTQVDTVLPYFSRWMERFPDFQSLASAKEVEVLKAWEGLGYYSRAKNLHKLAQSLSSQSKIPHKPEDWLMFPGVGPYTAAAITSISFGAQAAAVDGNVIRILARLTAELESFTNSGKAVKKFTPLAQKMLCTREPGEHNQAMMELGATVCLRRKPLCTVCPVLAFCISGRRGDPEAFPKLLRKPGKKIKISRVWIEYQGALLLHRLPEGSRRLARLYELPIAKDLAVRPRETNLLAIKQRGISNEWIQETIYRARVSSKLLAKVDVLSDFYWIPWQDLDKVTLSGPHRKWVTELR